ncbi:hypothetical protein B5E84_07285 [Lachnoclostridium sp. An14]|uniref:PTS transporter subunit EIIC n=1 Tax=Lachnoclostridium sp. An14 TaxID=1965562 RepID=UPI000B377637|nr:PTS transporter subunit EIIC [Lachnoclostridium sp. An14]OUQ19083.1 hypothetical protein B5E84_07285 [Lachnoclostridium sp. An14]
MAKESKFQELADHIIPAVGGRDNISFFTHCVTRLRFNLKDRDRADVKAIEGLKEVVGIKWSGEQLQVIIGTEVSDAYKLICKQNGMQAESAVAENLDKDLAGKKKFSLNAVIDGISGCITPLLPMLVGSGMLKVILVLLSQFQILGADHPTYVTLNFVADAAFYFLPVAVGVTGAQKFGANIAIGLMLGAALVHPNFVALVGEGSEISVFGIPILAKTYSSTAFPMVMTMWICGYVERFIAKHSPKVLRSVLEPVLTVLIMAPLMLCLIAPLGSLLSTYLTSAILWVYSVIGPLGIAIIACLHPLLVMTGMHTSLIPFVTEQFATVGYEPFLGVPQGISNLNQGIACLAVALKAKSVELKSIATTCGVTALISGTTEPAMFGVTLKYKTPLAAVMIGNFCGGLYAGIMHVVRYAYGGYSLLTLPVFIGENPSNFPNMMIAIAIGMVVTFISAMILYKPERAEGGER